MPDRRELLVDVLPHYQARELALILLGAGESASPEYADAIARESAGHPFFIHELVQSFRAASRPAESRAVGEIALDRVLWTRIQRLPEGARRLLEVVAVAGQPLAQASACQAAGLGEEDRATLTELRVGHLVRGTGSGDRDEIEAFHDRVRETVVARLTPAVLKDNHRRLVRTLEAQGNADPETLAVHYLGAEDWTSAGHHYALAADRAAEALAFDRAATLYQRSLEYRPLTGADSRKMRIKFGDALANAGRGAEAAHEYQAAIVGADDSQALEFQRRVAYQFCISGHIDEGKAALKTVLARVGLTMPATRFRTLLSLLFARARLWFRGLDYTEREADRISAEDLARIDVSWSAAIGLTMIDTIRGADFQTRNLLFALSAGEPYRLARALAWQASHVATAGTSSASRVTPLLQEADRLATRINHPHALGLVTLASGIAAYFQGRWQEARTLCDRSEMVFRDRCTGVVWELVTAQSFSLWSLFFLGETSEISIRLPRLLQEARGRGDLLAEASAVNFGGTLAWLARDDPDGAREAMRRAMGQWSRQEFHTQHFTSLAGQTQIDIYSGDAETAWARLTEQWPALKGSFLLRIQAIRVFMLHLRGRTALALATQAKEPESWLRAAEADARRLEKEDALWARPLAHLLRAGVAARRGWAADATSLLQSATAGFQSADMGLFAAAARRCHSVLLGGEEGLALAADADAWMTRQRIQNPALMTALHAPGFP
jgi:hypothetical protein